MKNSNVPFETKGEISLTIHFPKNGVYIVVGENEIASGTPTFKTGTSESNNLTVGGAVIGTFTVTLFNDNLNNKRFSNYKWQNAYIDVTYTISGITLDMGTYYVDKKTETGHAISLTCYDFMKFFDEYTLEDDGITEDNFPMYASNLVSLICERRGISAGVYGTFSAVTIEAPSNLGNITERAAISYCAQVLGKYAIIREGMLVLDWYHTGTVVNCGTTFGHDFDLENTYVDRLVVKTYSGTKEATGETKTDAGYELVIQNNPFITEDNLSSVMTNILNAVNTVDSVMSSSGFRAGSCSIRCNPAIEAGDILSVDTGDEDGIRIIATSVTFKTSTLQMTISSDANGNGSDARNSIATASSSGTNEGGGCNHPDAEIVQW